VEFLGRLAIEGFELLGGLETAGGSFGAHVAGRDSRFSRVLSLNLWELSTC
jgi:hypothetical protein